MPHTVKLVDSIAASPTVRLNLNDGLSWICKVFDAPPPRLRRSVTSNAMRDGINVSSSNYEARTVSARFRVKAASVDAAATQVQALARELDRSDNFLMLQLTGASKPVFFVTYRSDFSDLSPVEGDPTAFEFGVDILAESHALGLREDAVAAVTVTNNPAAATRGMFFDTPTILGDVPAPALIHANTLTGLDAVMASEANPLGTIAFTQAESGTLGTDTTNPGGGPDAAMSGTSANNYRRTSFATATMVDRLTALAVMGSANPGRYRMFVRVRRSDASSAIRVRLGISAGTGTPVVQYLPTVTLPLSTTPQLVDLGLFDYPGGLAGLTVGAGGQSYSRYVPGFALQAARDSGAGTLDWDYLWAVPAFQQHMVGTMPDSGLAGHETLFDTATEQIMGVDVTTFPTTMSIDNQYGSTSSAEWAGSLPMLYPGVVNRIHVGVLQGAVGATQTWSLSYWPRYLSVRPSAT